MEEWREFKVGGVPDNVGRGSVWARVRCTQDYGVRSDGGRGRLRMQIERVGMDYPKTNLINLFSFHPFFSSLFFLFLCKI